MKFLELAGGNLNFRHWAVSANNMITVRSRKPANLPSCEVDTVLAALEKYCQKGEQVDMRHFEFCGREQGRIIRGQGHSPSPHFLTSNLTIAKQRGMETHFPSYCSPGPTLERQFFIWSFHLSVHILLIIY